MNRHRLDPASLAFGIGFVIVLIWWFVGRDLNVGLSVVGWVIAVVLIVLGGMGLASSLRGSRHREPEGTPGQPGDDAE